MTQSWIISIITLIFLYKLKSHQVTYRDCGFYLNSSCSHSDLFPLLNFRLSMWISLSFRYANTSCVSAWLKKTKQKTFRILHHFVVPFLVCIGCKIQYSYLNVVGRLWITDWPSFSASFFVFIQVWRGARARGQERVDTFRARIEPDDTDLTDLTCFTLYRNVHFIIGKSTK